VMDDRVDINYVIDRLEDVASKNDIEEFRRELVYALGANQRLKHWVTEKHDLSFDDELRYWRRQYMNLVSASEQDLDQYDYWDQLSTISQNIVALMNVDTEENPDG
jgi:hypothetical protein